MILYSATIVFVKVQGHFRSDHLAWIINEFLKLS